MIHVIVIIIIIINITVTFMIHVMEAQKHVLTFCYVVNNQEPLTLKYIYGLHHHYKTNKENENKANKQITFPDHKLSQRW